MERDEILFIYHSNPEAIVDHLESLEIELNDVKEEVLGLKASSGWFVG